MNKNRSSIIITAAITVAAALLIGILIPVMSDGARFGGNGSADLAPAVQATLAARQAVVDASVAPDLPLFTPTPLAGAVQVAEVPTLPAATDTPAPAPTPTPTATAMPEPTVAPTEAPAGEVTVEPAIDPTVDPAVAPTSSPSAEATETPLVEATPAPEGEVTVEPIVTETALVDPGAGGVVTPPAGGALVTVTITAPSGMNVRSGPSTATEVLTALPNAAVVPAVGRTADSQWIQIYLADLNANGWLFASLVTVEGDLAALPIAG